MSGRWPSLSFVALALAWSASLSFLAWGFSTPEEEWLWTLRHELQAGRKANLSEREFEGLGRALSAHPRLLEDLLDGERLRLLTTAEAGWLRVPGAVLLRAPGVVAEAPLRLEVELPPSHLPLEVTLRCGAERSRLRCERQGAFALPMPAGEARLCQLELQGPPGRPLPERPALRLRLPEGPSHSSEGPAS